MSEFRIILSTAGRFGDARRIAATLVERRLVACVNMVPGVESIYHWQGKVETSQEVLLVIKTTAERVPEVLTALEEIHSYEVPEALVLPVEAGLESYLAWIASSVQK